MSYDAKVFKVMIASPSDVISERNIIREVLAEWNVIHSENRRIVLLPIGWESHSSPAMGDHPQSIINKTILSGCDLLVGVFWTRVGTPTSDYASGTVEEIEEHIKNGKPAMLYFSSAPVHPDSIDQNQYAVLKEFKDSCKPRGLLESYSIQNDFKDKFFRQLQIKLNEYECLIMPEIPQETLLEVSSIPDIPRLSREAQILLKEAVQDQHGTIIKLPHIGGLIIQANGKGFVESGNPRSRALWEGVLNELENYNLIEARGHKREVFGVTREGYQVAELVNP